MTAEEERGIELRSPPLPDGWRSATFSTRHDVSPGGVAGDGVFSASLILYDNPYPRDKYWALMVKYRGRPESTVSFGARTPRIGRSLPLAVWHKVNAWVLDMERAETERRLLASEEDGGDIDWSRFAVLPDELAP